MVDTSKNEPGLLCGDLTLKVYYEDTDLSGFVYHANYLKFFERAREELFGIEKLASLRTEGLHFVVTEACLHYREPARHGQTLTIKTSCEFSRSPVQNYDQRAYVGDRELVKASIKVACLNPENRPVRLPRAIIDYMNQRGCAK